MIKKNVITWLCLLIAMAGFSATNSTPAVSLSTPAVSLSTPAVSMVSYEQGSFDDEGTLALKNNTNETIQNISFTITYLDMKGTPLDNEDFFLNVDIEPGMTKKVNIPAYEHARNYHYYQTPDKGSGHPAFKIRYKLKDYNIANANKDTLQVADEDTVETEESGLPSIILPSLNMLTTPIGITTILVIIAITIGIYVLVGVLAKRRNRSVLLWILLGLTTTPLLAIIILLCIGPAEPRQP